ncbi:malonyl-ACP O-methyltransferase BioC [Alteromonadaceae bacterium BrNp21-10]|nr:malonyl-ACP O-methyltransferase BioC [Alteromonadaceae bacterium BrNp21-10]
MNSQPQAIKQRIADQFSKAATNYDENASLQWQIAQEALALFGNEYQGNITLDIGAGTGTVTQQLTVFSKQVLAVDLALGMLQFAQQQNGNIHWIGGDAESLPLTDNSIDGVFSSMALQWCASMPRVFAELRRVLKPQGRAVIAIMTKGSYHEWHSCWHQSESRAHINPFLEHNELQQMALDAGFNVEAKQCQYVSQHNNVRSLLGSIKAIGANVVVGNANHQPLSRASLRILEQRYETLRNAQGLLPLTYQISFLTLVSKPNQ